MKYKIILITVSLAVALSAAAQTTADINKTDAQGKKQGPWIRKYPSGSILYEGTFVDDKPVGVFKRYNQNNSLNSVLVYSSDGRKASASFYHPNGFILSRGKYTDQLREGTWKFYSSETNGCLLSEENYSKNVRHGVALKYYPDSTVAEKISYINGIKSGEWTQYHPNGKIYLRTSYVNGLLDGKFETWYDNGKTHYSGMYRYNLRKGKWKIYAADGTLKHEIDFDNEENKDLPADEDSADMFNLIDKNLGRIPDPEKTGNIR
ncbi:MAG TPA: toxin-antitoxin system YwqK family antitoxin [Bacteroidales bacterium]|nr:toxin-antitoxin system YwqK family antitoxin [Bacteroidales bacterium]